MKKITEKDIDRLNKKYKRLPEGRAKSRAFQRLDRAILTKMCQEAGLSPGNCSPLVFIGSEDD